MFLMQSLNGKVWQVGESEMSKVNLIEENQELTNRISLLEVRVQHLEDEAAAFRTPAMMVPEVIIPNQSEDL